MIHLKKQSSRAAFLWPSCYFKTRPPLCALGTSFCTVLEGHDLMTYEVIAILLIVHLLL